MFVPEVIDRGARLTVVSHGNDDEEFRRRLGEMFPNVVERDYSISDFGQFCRASMDKDEQRNVQQLSEQHGT